MLAGQTARSSSEGSQVMLLLGQPGVTHPQDSLGEGAVVGVENTPMALDAQPEVSGGHLGGQKLPVKHVVPVFGSSQSPG